jgi:hypothetical protein
MVSLNTPIIRSTISFSGGARVCEQLMCAVARNFCLGCDSYSWELVVSSDFVVHKAQPYIALTSSLYTASFPIPLS